MEEEVEKWHLKKEVNITHLFATIAMMITIITWAMAMGNRVDKLEHTVSQYIESHENIHGVVYTDIKTHLAEIKTDIRHIRRQLHSRQGE